MIGQIQHSLVCDDSPSNLSVRKMGASMVAVQNPLVTYFLYLLYHKRRTGYSVVFSVRRYISDNRSARAKNIHDGTVK